MIYTLLIINQHCWFHFNNAAVIQQDREEKYGRFFRLISTIWIQRECEPGLAVVVILYGAKDLGKNVYVVPLKEPGEIVVIKIAL